MTTLVVHNRRDIIEYLADNPRNSPRVGILFAIAMTSVFADAYDLGSLSIGVSSLTAELGLTATQVGLVTSSTAIGALLSSLAGGIIADRTGRYRLFIIGAILLVIAPLGIAFSVNFGMVLAFRTLLGIAVGLDMPVAFSFMAELLSKNTQAKLINLWQPVSSFSNILGVLIALPFALALATSHLWRVTSGVGALIAIAALILRLRYSEESPLWSAKHQKLEVAGGVLAKAYGVTVRIEPDASTDHAAGVRARAAGVRQLFTRSHLRKTTLVTICAFVQQLQYYGVGFYLPVITAMVFGQDLVSTIIATVCAQGLALLSGLLGVRLTTKLGLRRLGLIGYTVALACLIGASVVGVSSGHASIVPVFLVAFMLAGSAFGPGPLSKTLAAVVYPTEIRGVGAGWSESMGRLGSIVGLFFFPVVLAAIGVNATMLAIAFFPFVAIVALSTLGLGDSVMKPLSMPRPIIQTE